MGTYGSECVLGNVVPLQINAGEGGICLQLDVYVVFCTPPHFVEYVDDLNQLQEGITPKDANGVPPKVWKINDKQI